MFMCQDVRVGARDALVNELRLLGEANATQTAQFQHTAASFFGLSVTDMRALSIVLRDGPQTAGQLAQKLSVTSGAVTGVIDRLSSLGLARRTSDDRDRRRVVVEADVSGLESRDNPYQDIGAAFDELHRSLTTAELRFLVRYLQASVAITAKQTALLAGFRE